MKTRSQKQSELGKLKEKLPKSTITIFTTFAREGEKGLSVAQMQELKRALRALNGSEYLIAKKSLTDLSLKELKYDGVDIFGMKGSLGVVVGNDDAYSIAKKVYEFAKKNQALQFFGALFDGAYIDADRFVEIAKMSSRIELIARLLGMMRYPLTSLAIVLKQISEAKEKNAPAPAPAAEPAAPAEATAPEAAPTEAPASAEAPAEPTPESNNQ